MDTLLKLAEKSKTDKLFFKIDAETCRIIEVIGNTKPDFPRSLFINATPETLIKDRGSQNYCRTAICLVHESQEPITIKVPITINDQTALQTIHIRPGRSNSEDTPTTIIAHPDTPDIPTFLFY